MKLVYAFTPADPVYPPYLNICRAPNGDLVITVRSTAVTGGKLALPGVTSRIVLPASEVGELEQSLKGAA